MYSNPCTRKYCSQTTPYYIPNRSAMCEVIAVVSRQQAVFDGWDRVCIDRGTLKQIIEKEEKEHSEGEVRTKRDWLQLVMQRLIS